mmetsp:Transcript_94149/g.186652  ORF Transcript_94149/g.186652 Transcript_94149/m.186652 type:complete len:206 (+) Transcript_94149:1345-1962(+)
MSRSASIPLWALILLPSVMMQSRTRSSSSRSSSSSSRSSGRVSPSCPLMMLRKSTFQSMQLLLSPNRKRQLWRRSSGLQCSSCGGCWPHVALQVTAQALRRQGFCGWLQKLGSCMKRPRCRTHACAASTVPLAALNPGKSGLQHDETSGGVSESFQIHKRCFSSSRKLCMIPILACLLSPVMLVAWSFPSTAAGRALLWVVCLTA